VYWILSLAVFGAALFLPGAVKAYKFDVGYLAESLALVRVGYMRGNPIIPPAWTLFHEIKFYAFFALLILIRNRHVRRGLLAAVATVTACVVICRAAGVPVGDLVSFYFGEYNLLFAAGVLAAWLIRRRPDVPPFAALAWVAAGMFVFVGAADNLFHWPELPCNLLYGICSAALILAVVGLEQRARTRPEPRPGLKPLLLIGDASYSIYLLHYPLFTALAILLLRTRLSLPLPVTVAGLLLAAVTGGCAMYLVLERPLLRSLKTRSCRERRHRYDPNPQPGQVT